MSKRRNDDFSSIDDYYEEDDKFYSAETDLSDVSYEDFNKPTNIVIEDEDDDGDADVVVKKNVSKKKTTKSSSFAFTENEELMDFLAIFWIWFRRIGIIIAVILIAYFITKGLFKDLFMYILLLVGSFFFGFGFMAVLTRVLDNR